MSAPQPSRSTRQSDRNRSQADPPIDTHYQDPLELGKDDSSEHATSERTFPSGLDSGVAPNMIEALQAQIRQLQLQLDHYHRRSHVSDQSLPTTESPPTISRQPERSQNLRYMSETPGTVLARLSERTPKIESLTDGKEPTFPQWQASIRDRLDINVDHYQSERARIALV